jgi:hypothetical protein
MSLCDASECLVALEEEIAAEVETYKNLLGGDFEVQIPNS